MSERVVESYQPPKWVSARTLFAYGLLEDLWWGSLESIDLDASYPIDTQAIDDILWGVGQDPYDLARVILTLEECREYYDKIADKIQELRDRRAQEQSAARQKREQLRAEMQPVRRKYDIIYYGLLDAALIATVAGGVFVFHSSFWLTLLAAFVVYLVIRIGVWRLLCRWRDRELAGTERQWRELKEPGEVGPYEEFLVKKNALLDIWEQKYPEDVE